MTEEDIRRDQRKQDAEMVRAVIATGCSEREAGMESWPDGTLSDLADRIERGPAEKRAVCPRCGGSGQIVIGPPLAACDGPQYGPCPTCNGMGIV